MLSRLWLSSTHIVTTPWHPTPMCCLVCSLLNHEGLPVSRRDLTGHNVRPSAWSFALWYEDWQCVILMSCILSVFCIYFIKCKFLNYILPKQYFWSYWAHFVPLMASLLHCGSMKFEKVRRLEPRTNMKVYANLIEIKTLEVCNEF